MFWGLFDKRDKYKDIYLKLAPQIGHFSGGFVGSKFILPNLGVKENSYHPFLQNLQRIKKIAVTLNMSATTQSFPSILAGAESTLVSFNANSNMNEPQIVRWANFSLGLI